MSRFFGSSPQNNVIWIPHMSTSIKPICRLRHASFLEEADGIVNSRRYSIRNLQRQGDVLVSLILQHAACQHVTQQSVSFASSKR
jgi:hypothetical protein